MNLNRTKNELDREARNLENENWKRIEEGVEKQKKRVDKLIRETEQPSEVVDARGEFSVLGDRLESVDEQLEQTVSEVINIKKGFGAVGDGVTDDTNAIQNAINYAVSNAISTVYFPPGNYLVTDITDLDKVFLIGNNASFTGIDTKINEIGSIPDFDKKRAHIISGVIRYYESEGKWDLLENQGQGHRSINIESVTSDSNRIYVWFKSDEWADGTKERNQVNTFIVVPDETLSSQGLHVGASVNIFRAMIDLYGGTQSAYINYNAAENRFESNNTSFTAEWTTTNGGGVAVDYPALTVGAERIRGRLHYPSVTGRQTPYNVTFGIIRAPEDGFANCHIHFYDANGNQVTTPNENMKFFINIPGVPYKLNPNEDFPDKFGNLWIYGIVTSDY